MAIDREAQKQELLKRAQEDYNRSSGTGGKYFNPEADFILWKPSPTKGDPHIIDIIPYKIGPDQPPMLEGKKRTAYPGEWGFFLQISVHRNIGPVKQSVLCPAKNYGKPCPICEHISKLEDDGVDWDEYSNIATMERCLYNVVVMTNEKEQKKGIRIWDAAYKYSQEILKSLAQDARTGARIMYHSPDRDLGKSIQFEVEKDKFRKVYGHKFLDRNYDISDKLQEDAYVLDGLLELLPYKTISDLFYNNESSEPETQAQQSRTNQETTSQTSESQSGVRRGLRRQSQEDTQSSYNPCPQGLNFGADIDTTPYCEKQCEEAVYKKCCEAADRIEMEKKQKEEEERLAAEKAAASTGNPTGRRSLRRG